MWAKWFFLDKFPAKTGEEETEKEPSVEANHTLRSSTSSWTNKEPRRSRRDKNCLSSWSSRFLLNVGLQTIWFRIPYFLHVIPDFGPPVHRTVEKVGKFKLQRTVSCVEPKEYIGTWTHAEFDVLHKLLFHRADALPNSWIFLDTILNLPTFSINAIFRHYQLVAPLAFRFSAHPPEPFA